MEIPPSGGGGNAAPSLQVWGYTVDWHRWFVSILVEDHTVRSLPPVDRAVGVDAGLASLVTLATGEKVLNPKHEQADRRKLAKAQRELARKQTGSANRAKIRLKVTRIHARLAESIPLHIRERPCGASRDRDVNAARNILAAGLAER